MIGKLEPFYPPQPSPAFLTLMDGLLPLVLRVTWSIRSIDLPREDRARLEQLQDTRALFTANHPSLAEPGVLYRILRQSRISSSFLTAWDTMTGAGRYSAWAFQRIGAYSVRRARLDRPSMEMTQKLLLEGGRILLFPEGQTYGLNDTLLPFHAGVPQLAFRALEALVKQGTDAPLLLVPMAVKYVYTAPMLPAIGRSLSRLEQALRLEVSRERPYRRISEIASMLLSRLEGEQGLTAIGDEPLDIRIDRLRRVYVERLNTALEAEVPRDAPLSTVVLALQNALEQLEAASTSAEQAERWMGLWRLWLRLKTFVGITDDYIREWPSAERFADVLRLLEREVLGKPRITGPQQALVRVGEPLDLREHLEAYRANRREGAARVADLLQQRVRELLEGLVRKTRPLPELAIDGHWAA